MVTYEKKPDESGGTKKNLEARLPAASLGVEMPMFLIILFIGIYLLHRLKEALQRYNY